MKKAIWFIVLISVMFIMTSCAKSCKTHSVCGFSEECINGKCKTAKCNSDCPDPGSVCKYTTCGQGNNFKCEIHNVVGSTSGCMGSVSGEHCMKLSCVEGECVEVTDTYCLKKEEIAKNNKEYCSDGTELGDCSMKKRGYYCNEITHELVLYDDEDGGNVCADDYDERNPKKAPILIKDPCDDGTSDGYCSTKSIGYICINQTLVADANCLPEIEEITECTDGTLIGNCSESKEGFRCDDEGKLVVNANCLPEEPVIVETGCGETQEGDCSIDGKWCIHDELIQDEACDNSCSDGTRSWSCSQHTVGFICQEGELLEDLPTCDPDYVYVEIDCEDGTLDGHCTDAEDGYWCNHGVLEYDETCYVNYDECGDGTLSGMCSEITPGEICFYGTLSVDDVCAEGNRCSDFTPNQECSKATAGYFCNEGALQEDQFC
jgi:hypothetical protein